MSTLHLAALAAVGVVAGFVNTLAGGGSTLTMPALMLLGLPPTVANGTNRVAIAVQAFVGATAFHRRGKLDVLEALRLVPATAIGAGCGAAAATLTPDRNLGPVLFVVLPIIALVTALKPKPDPDAPTILRRAGPKAHLLLFGAGLYIGFIQAGGGFLLLFVLHGLLGRDLIRANALKVGIMLALVLVVLPIFVAADQVRLVPGLVLASGMALGANLAVRLAVKRGVEFVRWFVVIAVTGACVAAALR